MSRDKLVLVESVCKVTFWFWKRDHVYFDEDLPRHVHYEEYGFNMAKIKYPYTEDIAQQFYDRMQGEGDVYNLPQQLMPDCQNMKCSKHNNAFSTDEADLEHGDISRSE